MYLVDTSIWVDYFNGKTTNFIEQLLLSKEVKLMPNIYTEVLQGVKNKQEFTNLKKVLLGYAFCFLNDNHSSYEQAALIYFRCRRAGITIRSNTDCLIAQAAIENDLILLHNDNDFIQMAKVITNLNTKEYT